MLWTCDRWPLWGHHRCSPRLQLAREFAYVICMVCDWEMRRWLWSRAAAVAWAVRGFDRVSTSEQPGRHRYCWLSDWRGGAWTYGARGHYCRDHERVCRAHASASSTAVIKVSQRPHTRVNGTVRLRRLNGWESRSGQTCGHLLSHGSGVIWALRLRESRLG